MNKPSREALDILWKTATPPMIRFCVLIGGLVCLLMGFLTMLAMGIVGLLDAAFMFGLGYGICIRRSRACAVIASLYYALNQLFLRLVIPGYAPAAGSTVLMYVFLVSMLLSVYGTFAFRKLVDETIQRAQLPPENGQE